MDNVYKQNITSWKDFKLVIKQLQNPKVQEKYSIIGVDTIDVASELCEKYICQTNGVSRLGELPYGSGWTLFKKELNTAFRDIAMAGYGLIFISHAVAKTEKDASGQEYERIVPACPNTIGAIVNKMVDFIIYIGTEYASPEDEVGTRYMYFKGNKHIHAGSRFPDIVDKCPFGYDELAKAVNDAIDKQVGKEGAVKRSDNFYVSDTRPFDEVFSEAKQIWAAIAEKDDSDATADAIDAIIEKNFGQRILLSQTTPAQQDALELTVVDLKELYDKL